MRTKEQTDNLRTVLSAMFQLPVWLISDDFVNLYADKLQKGIEEIKFTWTVRVRMSENKKEIWSNIEKEPGFTYMSLEDISSECWRLLRKYPTIDAIRISNFDEPNDIHYFLKEKLNDIVA